jgi:MFS family permease
MTLLQTRPNPVTTARPTRNPAIGMWIVLVGQLMLVLDATIVNVALPHISTDLHFGSASLSWVLNAYSLAFGGLLLLGGRLGDVLGRRRVFMTGLSLFTAASFAGGLAQAPWELVTSRALQGVGAALSAPSVLALIATNAPNENARNRALGAFAVISSGGAALGLMLGGALTDLVSWRWTMFVNVPIGLAVLLLVPGFVSETARRHGRFDFIGAGSATAAAVAGAVRAPSAGSSSALRCWSCSPSPSGATRTRCCVRRCCAAGSGSAVWSRWPACTAGCSRRSS